MRNESFGMVDCGETYIEGKVEVGSKLWFEEEVKPYTVRASNRFFSICTKPFNPQKTVLYTIVDWHNQIRGTENLVFGSGAETKEDCEDMLKRLTEGDSDISHRNYIPLRIIKSKLSTSPLTN